MVCSLRQVRLSLTRAWVLITVGILFLFLFISDWDLFCPFIKNKSNKNRELRSNWHVDTSRIARKPNLSKSVKYNLVSTRDPTGFFAIPPVPLKSASDYVAKIADDVIQKFLHYEKKNYTERIAILTPIHNVANKLPIYAKLLKLIKYPHHLISISFGEDCSRDSTLAKAEKVITDLRNASFSRVEVFHFDMLDENECNLGHKHEEYVQLARRKHLAKSRNLLLKQGLKDEDWVLWIDSDISGLPSGIIQQLLSANQGIVVPNCLYREFPDTERVFDKNTWRETTMSLEHQKKLRPGQLMLEGYSNILRIYLPDLRAEGRVVPIDGVGGCTLLVHADLHRIGLHFPENIIDHHIETEGLAKLAKRMGFGVYGMPFVNVYH